MVENEEREDKQEVEMDGEREESGIGGAGKEERERKGE